MLTFIHPAPEISFNFFGLKMININLYLLRKAKVGYPTKFSVVFITLEFLLRISSLKIKLFFTFS